MSTALQLVNRCLRRTRNNTINDSSSFTSREGVDMLEFVNEAMREILESRIWWFDREEFVVETMPEVALTSVLGTAPGVSVSATAPSGATVNGDFQVRLLADGSTNAPDTSFPLVTSSLSGTAWSGSLKFTTGIDLSGDTGKLFAAEYQLPSSSAGPRYRKVLSVMHQEEDLRLEEVQREIEFDSVVQRLHEDLGTDPEVVYTGMKVSSTNPASSANETLPGIMIWPVPSSRVVLSGLAVIYHPTLEAPEDTVDVSAATSAVPPIVEDLIVTLATARWMQGPGRAVQEGIALEGITQNRIRQVWHGTQPQPLQRNELLPLDHNQPVVGQGFGRLPSNVGSL